MKQKTILLLIFTVGIFISQAQTLTSSFIWSDVMPGKVNTDSLLVGKGFKLKYSGPKKQGGNLSCYFNKKADEWLFIHDDEQWRTTSISYLLPTLKKHQNNLIEKKLLLSGEEVTSMGKTYQENKLYYHLIYTFDRLKAPPIDE